ncbi:MAG: hypothetical protein AAB343_00940 [Patescibacteria group bacterium]
MSDGKDIRFIEPTNYVILPRPKKGMVGVLMNSFPSVIRTEAHANAALVFIAILFSAMSMMVVINSNAQTGLSRSQVEVYGND